MNPVLEEIEALYATHGDNVYGEGMTMAQHALQSAALAEGEGADDRLVIAALLHDIGHFLQQLDDSYGYHKHDRSGGDWLARHFGPEISEPARLHVAAKRYLCAVEPDYLAKLSPASVYTLSKQGGPMSPAEMAAFAAQPFAEAAVRLRRWDDGGKEPGLAVPDFAHYRSRLARLLDEWRGAV
jgi:[1-hydroxy-2-(trimethylamino)ethyl]phosphonate dioxygenase